MPSSEATISYSTTPSEREPWGTQTYSPLQVLHVDQSHHAQTRFYGGTASFPDDDGPSVPFGTFGVLAERMYLRALEFLNELPATYPVVYHWGWDDALGRTEGTLSSTAAFRSLVGEAASPSETDEQLALSSYFVEAGKPPTRRIRLKIRKRPANDLQPSRLDWPDDLEEVDEA